MEALVRTNSFAFQGIAVREDNVCQPAHRTAESAQSAMKPSINADVRAAPSAAPALLRECSTQPTRARYATLDVVRWHSASIRTRPVATGKHATPKVSASPFSSSPWVFRVTRHPNAAPASVECGFSTSMAIAMVDRLKRQCCAVPTLSTTNQSQASGARFAIFIDINGVRYSAVGDDCCDSLSATGNLVFKGTTNQFADDSCGRLFCALHGRNLDSTNSSLRRERTTDGMHDRGRGLHNG